MNQTAFIFGRTPQLSFLELRSYYPECVEIIPGIARVDEEIDASAMIGKLGGTVKIVTILSHTETFDESEIISILTREAVDGKITFGVSTYGTVHLSDIFLPVLKKQLVERGLSVRFVESRHDETLSSVVVSKQHVTDLVVISGDQGVIYGITHAVQDFEDWNRRDFGRPQADPKRGMLPPKVARMIVNIGIGTLSDASYTPTVLDPFCGVGTIVAESMQQGCSSIGVDISESAIEKAKKNIEWLRKTYPGTAPLFTKLVVGDATHLTEQISPESIDAIVTEPYLGENIDSEDIGKLTPEKIKNTLKGLEKLYIGSLKEWIPILKSGARVVMAMPAYAMRRSVTRVKNVVDRCESLGYTLITGPIEYSRPNAIVRREFFVFQKK